MMFEKLLSGRLFLVYVCGLVLCYCAWKGDIPTGIAAIISGVFTYYFMRQDRGQVTKK